MKEYLSELINFFKMAKHLWGKCPECGEIFRISEVAISYGTTVPRDEISRLLKKQKLLSGIEAELEMREEEIDGRKGEILEREHEITSRERNLNKTVKDMVKEQLKSEHHIKQLVKEERKSAVLKSRAVLLGKFIERFAPFLQKFWHDPRDIRGLHEPIDYICFDGLTVNREVDKITFVEVKSGTSNLTPTEKSILYAVRNGKVKHEVWQFGSRKTPLEQQLLQLPK